MPRKAEGAGDEKVEPALVASAGQVIHLTWASDSALATLYVNHVHISHVGPEFILVFGEAHLPPRSPQDGYPDEIPIQPIVRLAISPDAMTQIRIVIDENVDSHLSREDSE